MPALSPLEGSSEAARRSPVLDGNAGSCRLRSFGLPIRRGVLAMHLLPLYPIATSQMIAGGNHGGAGGLFAYS